MDIFKGLIYCAISPSNKKYYGLTTKTLEHRKNKHLFNTISGFKLPFHNAIRKYGIENFKWNIIEQYENVSKKSLLLMLYEREIYWIDKDNTYIKEFGYNISKGGSGADIFNMLSDDRKKEVRQIISEGVKNKWKDETYRNKVMLSRSTKEYKDKRSIKSKQQWADPIKKEKNLKNFKEKIWDNPERNEKIKKTLRNQQKFECPHCNSFYTRANYNRWHGDKCKNIN